MKKNVFIVKSMLLILPFNLLFVVVGLTSCSSELEGIGIDNQTEVTLKRIFNENNPLLRNLESQKVYIIKNEEELNQIRPENVEKPSIDFEGKCIVFASVKTASISDRLLGSSLCRVKGRNEYEFKVVIQKSQNGYTAIGIVFPYGIYEEEPESLEQIELRIEETTN